MPSTPSKTPRRQAGRPSAEDPVDARDALLEAASRLFATRPADDVSLRKVAETAGVSPAMVHYYFGSKEGLYEAMLQRMLGRVIARVRAVADERRDEPASAGDPLGDLLQVVIGAFAADPWVPTLVVREVLSESGRFREAFIRDYASQMATLLPGLMRGEIEAGRFRKDLDPQLAFLSFMGMTLLPFVARPVVERVLGFDYGEDFLQRFAAHTRRLFIEGAEA